MNPTHFNTIRDRGTIINMKPPHSKRCAVGMNVIAMMVAIMMIQLNADLIDGQATSKSGDTVTCSMSGLSHIITWNGIKHDITATGLFQVLRAPLTSNPNEYAPHIELQTYFVQYVTSDGDQALEENSLKSYLRYVAIRVDTNRLTWGHRILPPISNDTVSTTVGAFSKEKLKADTVTLDESQFQIENLQGKLRVNRFLSIYLDRGLGSGVDREQQQTLVMELKFENGDTAAIRIAPLAIWMDFPLNQMTFGRRGLCGTMDKDSSNEFVSSDGRQTLESRRGSAAYQPFQIIGWQLSYSATATNRQPIFERFTLPAGPLLNDVDEARTRADQLPILPPYLRVTANGATSNDVSVSNEILQEIQSPINLRDLPTFRKLCTERWNDLISGARNLPDDFTTQDQRDFAIGTCVQDLEQGLTLAAESNVIIVVLSRLANHNYANRASLDRSSNFEVSALSIGLLAFIAIAMITSAIVIAKKCDRSKLKKQKQLFNQNHEVSNEIAQPKKSKRHRFEKRRSVSSIDVMNGERRLVPAMTVVVPDPMMSPDRTQTGNFDYTSSFHVKPKESSNNNNNLSSKKTSSIEKRSLKSSMSSPLVRNSKKRNSVKELAISKRASASLKRVKSSVNLSAGTSDGFFQGPESIQVATVPKFVPLRDQDADDDLSVIVDDHPHDEASVSSLSSIQSTSINNVHGTKMKAVVASESLHANRGFSDSSDSITLQPTIEEDVVNAIVIPSKPIDTKPRRSNAAASISNRNPNVDASLNRVKTAEEESLRRSSKGSSNYSTGKQQTLSQTDEQITLSSQRDEKTPTNGPLKSLLEMRPATFQRHAVKPTVSSRFPRSSIEL